MSDSFYTPEVQESYTQCCLDRLAKVAFEHDDVDRHECFCCEDVRVALNVIDSLRSQVASLKNDLNEAVEAIRLHEQLARERRDTAAELEWRCEADRLASVAAT